MQNQISINFESMDRERCLASIEKLMAQEWPESQIGFRDGVIALLVEHVQYLEQSTGYETIGEVPEFDYQGACELMDLTDEERMNYLTRDEGEEFDALYDDKPAQYNTPMDWERVAEVVKVQLKMESVLKDILGYSNAVAKERDEARGALDRHFKAYKSWVAQGKFQEHQQKLAALKERNTRAREAAMALGRDTSVKERWEFWKELQAHCQSLVNDTRIWPVFFDIAPTCSRDNPNQDKIRVKRIAWMEQWLEKNEEYSAYRESINPLNPYWIDRDDDGRCDDYSIHNALLNRGDGLSQAHLTEVFWKEDEDYQEDASFQMGEWTQRELEYQKGYNKPLLEKHQKALQLVLRYLGKCSVKQLTRCVTDLIQRKRDIPQMVAAKKAAICRLSA